MLNEATKTVVIYNSKYGSTRQFATWIAEEISADLFSDTDITISDLHKYSTIVFGGSLHAVGIKGIKLITKNFEILKNKKIIIFAVGCSPGRPEALTKVFNHNFGKLSNKDLIHFFYLRGSFNFTNLTASDKLLMNALKAKIKLKKDDEVDEDSKNLLACYDRPVDWTDPKAIIPIIECIKK